MGILSRIFGNGSKGEAAPGHIHSEQGFVDIDLPITDLRTLADGTTSIVARGKLDGAVVGFIVDVLPQWKTQDIEEGLTFHWGQGAYRSLGAESDEFIALLARRYEIDSSPLRMASHIDATAVCLEGDPRRLLEAPVRMKFFLAEDSEDYSEVYTNLDIAQRVLQFHEKDRHYRESLLRVLSGAT